MPVSLPGGFGEPPDFGSAPPAGEAERERVVEALGPTPVSVDELIRHTGLPPAQMFMILLELDLAGRLERHAGGAVSLVMDVTWPGRRRRRISRLPHLTRPQTAAM